jgi:signal transduction protein with GAF and PtsI domain
MQSTEQLIEKICMSTSNLVLLKSTPKVDLHLKLKELRKKQKIIDAKWEQAGDRKMLSCFVELVPMALNVERCSIFIADPKSANVWLQCGTGVKERSIKVAREASIVGETIATGKSVIVEDLEDRTGAHFEVAVKTGFTPKNTLCVPIFGMASRKVAGVIQVLNKTNYKFGQPIYSENDIQLLEKLAYNIQMTIENIYLRQEFSKISRAMSQQIKLLEDKLRLM